MKTDPHVYYIGLPDAFVHQVDGQGGVRLAADIETGRGFSCRFLNCSRRSTTPPAALGRAVFLGRHQRHDGVDGGLSAFGKPGSPARRLLPSAVAVLLVSAIAAPISLLADLHQPGRFWHFYAHATPWSWMWLGALLLPCFVGWPCCLAAAGGAARA